MVLDVSGPLPKLRNVFASHWGVFRFAPHRAHCSSVEVGTSSRDDDGTKTRRRRGRRRRRSDKVEKTRPRRSAWASRGHSIIFIIPDTRVGRLFCSFTIGIVTEEGEGTPDRNQGAQVHCGQVRYRRVSSRSVPLPSKASVNRLTPDLRRW